MNNKIAIALLLFLAGTIFTMEKNDTDTKRKRDDDSPLFEEDIFRELLGLDTEPASPLLGESQDQAKISPLLARNFSSQQNSDPDPSVQKLFQEVFRLIDATNRRLEETNKLFINLREEQNNFRNAILALNQRQNIIDLRFGARITPACHDPKTLTSLAPLAKPVAGKTVPPIKPALASKPAAPKLPFLKASSVTAKPTQK